MPSEAEVLWVALKQQCLQGKKLARALEFDNLGRLIQTDGIPFNPPFGKLHSKMLERGDVLVWYTSNIDWKTAAIQEFSHGPFSHVGIYIGDGLSVDAGPAGVEEVGISDLIENFDYGWVFRKSGLTSNQRAKIVAAARSNVGRAYAWMDAISLPARRRAFYADMTRTGRWNWVAILGRRLIAWRMRWPPSEDKTFCSRMVIEAFADVGPFRAEHCTACAYTPFDLAADTFFEPVGWLCKLKCPVWHAFDPYSPQSVKQPKWAFSPMRIWFAKRRAEG